MYGKSLWGQSPWGGPGFGPTAALAIRENVIRIAFSDLIYASDLGDEKDAVRSGVYVVTPFLLSVGNDGTNARPVRVVNVNAPTVVDGIPPEFEGRWLDLTLDRPMTPFPAAYQVAVSGVWSADKSTLAGSATLDVDAVYRQLSVPTVAPRAESRDLANPQTIGGAKASSVRDPYAAILGTFQVDDSGDYAFDSGLESFRKRVIRRCITKENGFAHLPGYGASLVQQGKKLGTAARLAKLVANIEQQVALDPECVSASARIIRSTANPSFARVELVCTRRGTGQQTFSVPFMLAT